jgi:hypothetical protein
MYGTRIDLDDSLKQPHYALFCSRSEIYLCTVDNLAPMKKWFGDGQPGARVQRGLSPSNETEVRF